MKNALKNLMVVLLFVGVFVIGFPISSVSSLTIVLDPGHGGNSSGCCYKYNNDTVKEKDLNYKIASFMKNELSKYKSKDGKKVNVHLTHNNLSNPTISERIDSAVKVKADVLISLHNNASPSSDCNYRGAMALVTGSNFNNKYKIEEKLAKCILNELNKIGLQIQSKDNILGKAKNTGGLLRRLSDDKTTYPNGDTTDWYGIVRQGILKNVPSILIEHAYLSNEKDYTEFLSTDNKLKLIAKANTTALAKYYGLILNNDLTDKKSTLNQAKDCSL